MLIFLLFNRIFSVEIYEGLTREEARSVAYQHNARCETLRVTFQVNNTCVTKWILIGMGV